MDDLFSSQTFVGRELELAYLQGRLVEVGRGRGGLVLITGPAGIGKTHLSREVQRRARFQGIAVFEGVCDEYGNTPYRPWRTILQQLVVRERPCIREALRTQGEPFRQLLPELAEQFEVEGGREALPLEEALAEAIAHLVQVCRRPVLFVLEDLQYADAETVALLDRLGRVTAGMPLLIFGLYRDDKVASREGHPLHRLLRQARLAARYYDGGEELAAQSYALLYLESLTEKEVAQLLNGLLAATGVEEPPPSELLTSVMTATGGNPLLLKSLIHTFLETEDLHYDGTAWRFDAEAVAAFLADAHAVLRRRLARVADHAECLELLRWAAVMGPWLDVRVLSAASGFDEAMTLRLLAEAREAQLLEGYAQDEGAVYRFSDDRVRRAIYDGIPPEERVRRHRHLGEVLRRLYPEAQVAESLAWHFEQGGESALALRYARLAAEQAKRMHAHETAIHHYSRALRLLRAVPHLSDPRTEYALLAGREACYRRVGNRRAQLEDLEVMARLAQEMGHIPMQIEVATRQVALANQLGNPTEALHSAEMAFALARQVGDRKLEANSLMALGEASFRLGEQDRPKWCYVAALHLYRELGDRAGEANSLHQLGRVAHRAGEPAQARSYYEQALSIYRELRDRAGEAHILNALGVLASDYAQARNYLEQSLAIMQALGDRAGQGRAYNNLALIYLSLGLYERAREYLERTVRIEREMEGRTNLAYYLESLGRVYLEMGDYAQARRVFEEGRVLAVEIGDRWAEAAYWLGLGRVALATGELDYARNLIQVACDIQREIENFGELATSLAWLGMVLLRQGEWESAQQVTAEAVAHLEASGASREYAPQDIWWARYQVLRAAPDRMPDDPPGDEMWQAIRQAREAMLNAVVSLSDEGLRRNYLNRVRTNRAIIAEWARLMARYGTARAAVAVLPPSRDEEVDAQRIQDRLKRVLAISLQMNEKREEDALLTYVMEQVIELTGAERGFLALLNDEGAMEFRIVRDIEPEVVQQASGPAEGLSILDEVIRSKAPLLLQDVRLGGKVAAEAEEVPDLERRSVLCVPLLARANLIGLIYADNRAVVGRFSPADVDLLTLFANQAAVAIENLRLYEESVAWAHTLEERVAERTAALRRANEALSRRAVQLEASNQVGQQLIRFLEVDRLLARVVEVIRTQFDYYFVGIWLVEEHEGTLTLRAGAGRTPEAGYPLGAQLPLDQPHPISQVARTGKEIFVDSQAVPREGAVFKALPGTRLGFAVPLRIGDAVMGVLGVQSDRVDALTLQDRQVLQTLAAQVSIALHNARLYETEQRRRHLAESLERAGRELSRSLDLDEVLVRILDQLATVVPYERCSIMLAQDGVLRIVAQRGFPEERVAKEARVIIREDDVFLKMAETRRPVVIDDVTQVEGWQFLEGLRINKSWMGVPLVSQDDVIGMFSITRPEAAAFSEEEALLASAFASQAAVALQNARLYDELHRAYQRLERLDETKANFIEVTAHELRTPLTILKGYAQMLSMLPSIRDDSEAQPMLEGILSGLERLHSIINNILDVTKIDTQVLRLSPRPTEIAQVLGQVEREFVGALEERRLTLVIEGVEVLPPVEADPRLLHKVFYHLIVNAIKYTPDGGRITVRGEVDPSGRWVEVVVSDTGIGIDAEHQELIFEKFYQIGEISLHSSGRTKFKGGGPGLGLAIARGIVEAHGGRIWVESEGHDEVRCPGSHFHVRLPVGGIRA